jgi:hypothetical protein
LRGLARDEHGTGAGEREAEPGGRADRARRPIEAGGRVMRDDDRCRPGEGQLVLRLTLDCRFAP